MSDTTGQTADQGASTTGDQGATSDQQQQTGQATGQTGEQQQGQQTSGEAGGDENGDETDPRVQRANRQAAQYRTELRAAQQQLEQATTAQQTMLDNIAKALGLKADDAADPAAQVSDLTGKVETLTTRTSQLEAELLVHTIAADNGGNPVALLDSRTFASKLHGLDPTADDYGDQVAAAIKDAVATNPTLRSGQAPSAGGADTAGQGAGGGDAITADQFKSMSYKDRTALAQRDPALYRRLADSLIP